MCPPPWCQLLCHVPRRPLSAHPCAPLWPSRTVVCVCLPVSCSQLHPTARPVHVLMTKAEEAGSLGGSPERGFSPLLCSPLTRSGSCLPWGQKPPGQVSCPESWRSRDAGSPNDMKIALQNHLNTRVRRPCPPRVGAGGGWGQPLLGIGQDRETSSSRARRPGPEGTELLHPLPFPPQEPPALSLVPGRTGDSC